MADVYLGTDLKIKVALRCEGFSMLTDNFIVVIKCGKAAFPYEKSSSAWVRDDNNNYYLCLPTENLSGLVSMVATLHVPDDDFNGGIRREVLKQDMFNIKRP